MGESKLRMYTLFLEYDISTFALEVESLRTSSLSQLCVSHSSVHDEAAKKSLEGSLLSASVRSVMTSGSAWNLEGMLRKSKNLWKRK